MIFEAIDAVPPLWFYGACGAILLLIALTERMVIQRGGR